MLPLAINGKITMKENFLIAERIKSILSKEVVIMIGNEKVPSCVLPSLPHEVNDEYTYHYLTTYYSFKLEESNVMAPSTFKYVYGVVITKHKEKPIKQVVTVYYFRWKSLFITDNKVLRDKRRMPSEYDEILQLAMVYKPGETICISNRRKEVFSLLHMFYTFCYIMKEPIGFIDALQLHTEKCNGSMLDRDELLFVMAVIMEWAFQSDSLTDGLDESHREWCHSYAIMAAFMRKNPNIRISAVKRHMEVDILIDLGKSSTSDCFNLYRKLIHPDYLTKLDEDVKKSLLHDYFQSSPQFSERNSVASIDRFHRKNVYHSSIEKKECKNNKKSTIESKNKLSLSIKKEKQKKAEVISKNKVVEAEKKSKKFDDTEATQLSSLKYTVAVS
ncbi:hypothetical protein DICVIV_13672 [Dictyocaulus viviparus]|uniref:Uncharacterized protein n=1 Tax=Dictyocaulus viviparus TaxID=29172 RepID=A0A0D8X9D2_DICVI|nr:hypothetical protein DICVIV_13672 [Dictyocaulus viviparus]